MCFVLFKNFFYFEVPKKEYLIKTAELNVVVYVCVNQQLKKKYL